MLKRFKKSIAFMLVVFFTVFHVMAGFAFAADIDPIEVKKEYFKSNLMQSFRSVDSVSSPEIKDRQLMVKVEDRREFQKLAEELDIDMLEVPEIMKDRGIFLVKIPEDMDFQEATHCIKNMECVKYAEPNYIIEQDYIPNDRLLPFQWHLDKLNMKEAWDDFKGSRYVKVAVLDSGIDFTHPDLIGRVMRGYDFVNNRSYFGDIAGHGTAVSGIIGAEGDNWTGISGIDLRCDVLPIKVGDSSGVYSFAAIMGIYYAIEQGADVINLSFSGYYPNMLEFDALWDAYESGIVIVASSGNDGMFFVDYPAAFPHVMAVGATDMYDNIASFSNGGSALDICAPGVDILSTTSGGGYDFYSGTSFSSPVVAAVAGLVKGKKPYLAGDLVRYMLESSARMPSGRSNDWNMLYGYGIVDAKAALNSRLPNLSEDAPSSPDRAERINVNEDYYEKFDFPLDDDTFCFEVKKPGEFEVRIDSPQNIKAIGYLYRYEDGILKEEIGEIDSGFKGEIGKLKCYLDPGEYVLHVFESNGHWGKEPYILRVSGEKQEQSNDNFTLWEKKTSNLKNKVWKITFNYPLDQDTVDSDSVKVFDEYGNEMAVDFKISNDKLSIFILPPSQGYKSNMDYNIILTEDIRSQKGSKLRKPVKIPFEISK